MQVMDKVANGRVAHVIARSGRRTPSTSRRRPLPECATTTSAARITPPPTGRSATRSVKAFPDSRELCQANRAFLHRAPAALCEEGVDQFLDLGSGIPTVGNVHEVVRELNPGARTVYVDSDAVAFAHGQALPADVPGAVGRRL
jgi:hypothetical protein